MPEGAPRKVLYLTGTRADFGLLQRTLRELAASPALQLRIVATGMHLSRQHGFTLDEVRASGLPVCAEIELDMTTRTGASMAIGIGDLLRQLVPVLEREQPDFLLLLGDRGEMLAGAIAALHLGIACVHLHGGERSGTVDEPVRHAISKLASYHFVATPGARDRLLAMGEEAGRVFVTGAPGLDGLQEDGAMPREAMLSAAGLQPGSRFILAMFHPVVQQAGHAERQAQHLARALGAIGLPVLWLDPNADAGSAGILQALDGVALPAGSRRVTHLPRGVFAAAMRHCEVMAGNSSAGIIEAATFGTPVVNIGDRQRLRDHGPNVVDVEVDPAAIESAVRGQLSHGRWPCENAWGDGRASARIAQLLSTLPAGAAVLEKINAY